ncbi:hypothetical protein VTJ49DRAFT_7713 [Mycothermus thermophilus]|uniref:3-beta hydroxysteroid dehydrogenase/isomerase domain-containing protein n=1 Tax=Humicola insolens TaxID=85995 RepID=A0ABR3VGA0_HUMIN
MPALAVFTGVLSRLNMRPAASACALLFFLLVIFVVAYLIRLNQLLLGIPHEVAKLSPKRWTRDELVETYHRLKARPITPASYAARIPPKLERRYIVTGGSGLVGSAIVRQLLARGQPPSSIRIVDFRPPRQPFRTTTTQEEEQIDFTQTDISSLPATLHAFTKPWPSSVAHLPLTVFHTAAVIVPADRSPNSPGRAVCEAVNVRGTQNVVDAARKAGADVLVATTSGSIALRPVGVWVDPWKVMRSCLLPLWVLDERDFFAPLRPREEFYANYPASKAAAERLVCGVNGPEMRTGCVRPVNGVYGDPTDNTVGGSLARAVLPTWMSNIVQSFVHCDNVAVAHLDFEAVLAASPTAASLPQAGRPFVVTDPNPPIRYGDLHELVGTLVLTPFCVVPVPPVVILLLSYFVEGYVRLRTSAGALAPWSWLRRLVLGVLLPEIPGEAKHLTPAIFSICTHLVANNETASKPVSQGGIGYTGVLTTLEGMAQEVIEWNRDHEEVTKGKKVVQYQRSVSLADEIAKATNAATVMAVASS